MDGSREPLFTGPPEKMTTFMWEAKQSVAHYEGFGAAVAYLWCTLAVTATACNVVVFFRRGAPGRAPRLFLLGWLTGTFGLFMVFGDDLFLYSPLWTFHWVAWVILGLGVLVPDGGTLKRWVRFGAYAFAFALVANNAAFVHRMLESY